MRTVALLAALALPVPALAGGVAPIVTGGFHTEQVTFYSSQKDGGKGADFSELSAYEQYKETQYIGNVGSGLELVLGDRDDLIQGVFRGYWMMDTPQSQPDKGGEVVDADALVAEWRENVRHVGVGTVGINFGVVRAANEKFKFAIAAHIGTGFATSDHSEFLLAQLGGNMNYAVTRTVEVFVDVDYALRLRKTLSHGAVGTAGVRIMFD